MADLFCLEVLLVCLPNAQLLLLSSTLLEYLLFARQTVAEVTRHLQDEALLRVNALGPLWLTQALLPLLASQVCCSG